MTALPSVEGPIHGTVRVPGSKSETNRALVLAALADGPSRVTGALHSRDSALMVDALRALGTEVDVDEAGTVRVRPAPFRGGGDVDCGLAGTVMRFVPPMVLLADGPVAFHGDEHASARPMAGLLDALRELGARVDGDALPFRVTPGVPRGGEVVVDASGSSQFVSGLLLVGARLDAGLRIRLLDESLPSRPHVAMTVAMLREHGVRVDTPDARTWVVTPGPIRAMDTRIEPDLTNASVFLAAAAVAGGTVRVPGWPPVTTQPGARFLDIASQMGCDTKIAYGMAMLRGSGALHSPGTLDLHDAAELTPVVAALAALADGTTTLTGIAHVRGHETDRIAAIVAELRRCGIAADELDDGLRITGGTPRPATLRSYADHRMVHLAALIALVTPGTEVDDLECVSKTMPDFPERWAGIL